MIGPDKAAVVAALEAGASLPAARLGSPRTLSLLDEAVASVLDAMMAR